MATVFALVGILFAGLGRTVSVPDTLFLSESSFGSFDEATRITIGPAGRIYVIDSQKNAVVIFKSPQDSPSVLGGYGWTSVTFDRPSGVATDGLNVYVSDFGNHRIQRFDRYSDLISTLYTRDSSYTPAQFGYPAGVALSNQGDLIVLDAENLRVVEFSADSRFEREFGDLNAAGGKLQNPIKVCSDGNQFIYVVEKFKIVEFDFYGNYLRTFAQDLQNEIAGGQTTPNGIAIVSADTLYWFNVDGSLSSKTPFGMLIADGPVASVQDVAFLGDRLFVLTPHRCFIFKMETANH